MGGLVHFLAKSLAATLLTLFSINAEVVNPGILDSCPGYTASNVQVIGGKLTADLKIGPGNPCNVFGQDIPRLSLLVEYQTATRIHLKITDPANTRYEVPESVLPRPRATLVSPNTSAIYFNYTSSPFSFTISRASTSEVLFSTASHPLIFEPQYLRVKTDLPAGANIYGLGEHSETFRLPTHNTTRTFWSRDSFGVPPGTNLYGNHPVYFEHRKTGTHGVFLLNSNGMDVKIDDAQTDTTTLEYNVIGGVLDFYFLAGSETDPAEVARQYAEIVGTPAEVPYWSFGLHQCRFGYNNFVDVANVITNYSTAGIPLETMWTDIDYMYRRRIFTVDPDYFPMSRMREIVDYLHAHDQRYVLMTDPAVAYLPGVGYSTYDRGTAMDVWLKAENGSSSLGVVWPGVTVYPDWFHPKIQDYWSNEFALFYNPYTGIDIDGAWIDMNEPTSFCVDPCDDPFAQAAEQNLPPVPTSPPPDPKTPIFGNSHGHWRFATQSKRDLLVPEYAIENAAGSLSSRTAWTNAKHANGLVEYDTHNLFGTMMSVATRLAMLARRPGKRTLIITRSTFAGAGKHVGKWLGDNISDWEHYRNSIAGILGMASVFQVPMVGADICGFGGDVTENLCARWATLGGFYPFMRNHNSDTSISQEFYVWPTVAQAAKNVLDIRYRLMDYIYTAFHQANLDGTPVLNPLFYNYPKDSNTYSIDLQFFYGKSLMVAPVIDQDSTSVTVYFPKDIFYDFKTLASVRGAGTGVTLINIAFTEIPLYIKGGAVLPLRMAGAMTTTALRQTNFEFIVAPGMNGKASGELYIDDGESITPRTSTQVTMNYTEGALTVKGTFGYATGVSVERVRFLGIGSSPRRVSVNGRSIDPGSWTYDGSVEVLSVAMGLPFTGGMSVRFTL